MLNILTSWDQHATSARLQWCRFKNDPHWSTASSCLQRLAAGMAAITAIGGALTKSRQIIPKNSTRALA